MLISNRYVLTSLPDTVIAWYYRMTPPRYRQSLLGGVHPPRLSSLHPQFCHIRTKEIFVFRNCFTQNDIEMLAIFFSYHQIC